MWALDIEARDIALVAECGVRPGAAPISSAAFDLPFGPSLGPALREVKAFSPWTKRFLGQQFFTSGAELLAVFPDRTDAVGERLIRSQFDRV